MHLSENILQRVENLILVADERGEMVYVSPSVEKILGFSPKSLLGNGWWDMRNMEPSELKRSKEYISQCALGEVPPIEGNYLSRIETSTGKPKYLLWHDSRLEGNQVLGVGIDYSKNRKESLANQVIYNISERAGKTDDDDALFRYIAEEIVRSFETKNVYIALFDEDEENISFPIYIDEEFPEGVKLAGNKEKIRGSVTEYTIHQSQPKFFTGEDLQDLQNEGVLKPIGNIPKLWLGIPLKFGEKTFGLIAIQEYEIEDLFDEKDVELLKFISREISSILQRKSADKKLKYSEQRYRFLTEALFEGIAIHDTENILNINSSLARMFGYSEEELLGKPILSLFSEEHHESIRERIREKNESPLEAIGIVRNGTEMFLELIAREQEEDGKKVRLLAVRNIDERKRAEKAEEEAQREARFKAMVQNSSEIIALLDEDSNLTFLSPSIERILGIAPEKLVGKNLFEFIYRDEVELVKEAFKAVAYRSGEIERLEFHLRNALGQRLTMLGVFNNLMDDELVGGILLSALDITERKAAELTIQESEHRFRALFEQSPDPVFVQNEKGFILDANNAAAELHEMEREELMGTHVTELVPEEYRDEVAQSYDRIFNTETNYMEGYSLTRSGKSIPVEIRLGRANFKGEPAIILQIRDITRRKEAEARLLASREELRKQNETLLALAKNRHLISGNTREAFKEITRSAAEATSTDRVSIWSFTDKRDAILLDCEFNLKRGTFISGSKIKVKNHPDYFKAIDNERFVVAENTKENDRTKAFSEGKYTGKTTALIHAPIRLGGKISGMISFEMNRNTRNWSVEEMGFAGSMADLVALSIEEYHKRKAEEELLQRNFELDNFVYKASHDLKAPLNSIMGLINLIDAEENTPNVVKYLSLMNKSVIKLESFILDLADYSRNARLEVSSELIPLKKLVEEVVGELYYMENAQKTDIRVEVDEKVPYFSDPVRMRIIFNNFISNAIKYQDPEKESGWVQISVKSRKSSMVIEVSDNGMGIPEEHQAKIFNMFFRASVHAYGSGLGLYIVKDAIEKLDGEVNLKSAEGKGTSFTITLPNLIPETTNKVGTEA